MEQASFLLTLLSPISLTINLYILVSFLAKISLCVDDPRFLACSVPKSCGDGPNITFPFYIQDRQESFCGLPGHVIACNNNGHTNYIVHKIFYQNHTLRVSNADFSNLDLDCIPPTKNIYLTTSPFELLPGQTHLLLLYNCSNSSLLHGLPRVDNRCYAGNKTSLVVASHEENRDLWEASKVCETGVVAPVEAYGGISDELPGALENGFWLKWKAPDCSDCQRSGGSFGLNDVTYRFQCFCTDGRQPSSCVTEKLLNIAATNASRNARKLIVGLLFGGSGVGLMLVLLCCFRKKLFSNNIPYFWKKRNLAHKSIEAFIRDRGPLGIRRYNYSNIKKMTNSFKDKLGKGGYGSVYKGKLQDGCLAAIKVLKESKGNEEEFVNEVISISRTAHVNIVALVGFCFEGSKRALMYEFMPNGSIDKFIYKEDPP